MCLQPVEGLQHHVGGALHPVVVNSVVKIPERVRSVPASRQVQGREQTGAAGQRQQGYSGTVAAAVVPPTAPLLSLLSSPGLLLYSLTTSPHPHLTGWMKQEVKTGT